MGHLLIALSLFITVIFPIIIALFGLSYYGGEDGPYYLITVLGINILTIVYIVGYEIKHHKESRGAVFPYFIPIILAFCFLIEMALYPIGEAATTQFRNDAAIAMVGIFGGAFCARYNIFDEVMKSIELIMLVCTISLTLSLPTLYMSGGATIGGGGTHQTISYIAAFSFALSYYRVITTDKRGYHFFTTKFYSYIAFLLMALQALICIIGGGRGGAVLLVAITVLYPLYIKQRKRSIIALLSLLAIAVIGMNYIKHTEYGELLDLGIQRAFSYLDGGSIDMSQSSERDVVYSSALRIVKGSPILGYGLFHQYDVFESLTGYPYCHNMFIELLLQGGIIFLFIGVLVIMAFVYKTHRILFSDPNMLLLLPMFLYPMLCLQFSGTWVGEPLFWFAIVYVFEYKCIRKRGIVASHANR